MKPGPTLARRLLPLGWVLLTLIALPGVLWIVLRAALAPPPGDWAAEIGRGPFKLQASVPQLVWLATTPWIGERLAGRAVPSRLGPLTLGWVSAGGPGDAPALTLRCQPCRLPLPPALGQPEGLRVPAAQITLARGDAQSLHGTLRLEMMPPRSPAAHGALPPAGALAALGRPGGGEKMPPRSPAAQNEAALTAHWQARRAGPGWRVVIDWPAAPARQWFELLAPGLPELAAAQIEGTLALRVELPLPPREGTSDWRIAPRIEGLTVSGLGTQDWALAQSACGRTPPLPARHWLARAVLAAEDQRFYEHTGFDPEELAAALQANQQAGAIRRGASTLSQQLAKLMVTGGERQLERKARELLYALDAEAALGKGRILQLYLANAPWGIDAQGRPICGAQAAARHYFGVSARRLTPRQAVTLAAMLHNPQMEAARWRAEGGVSSARLHWVAAQVRGVQPAQRRALLAQLDEPEF
ncbi:MAG: transglycosylase domain-containing protein [Burkholderiaceae bacterium]|jgi:hypothetical protein|nr:transglycosylase domain-containing protein [Burkholderiaceae bacterium]